MDRLFSRPIFGAAFVSLVAFVVYQFTLAPSVDFIDSGELATVCYTLGIAHPTGYPLFTIVGWIFAHLPIAASVIARLNEMAALFTALGAGTLTLLSLEIFSYWLPDRTQSKQPKVIKQSKTVSKNLKQNVQGIEPAIEGPSNLATVAAIATGLVAAFSATWWSQSTGIEVYPLHLFLIPIVMLFLLRMLRLEYGKSVERDGVLFALVLGLSFSNHMTTVLLAPASIYAFVARYGFNAVAFNRILRLAPWFIGGLLLYLYLPLRSSQYPIMDWGHPATLPLFLKHVTGGQYKIWMFQSGAEASKQWHYFWQRAPIEFTVIGAIAAALGLYGMLRSTMAHGVHMLVFTLLLFFGCILYAINYSIHDIDSYFLLAFLAMSLWIGAGLITAAGFAKPNARITVVALSALIVAVFELGMNYSEVDESGNRMVEDYTKNMLSNLPHNAIVFSTQWDFWVSGAYYYQLVEKMRPDVLVIDKAMLRDRPSYFEYIRQRAPEVLQHAQPEVDNFLVHLRHFDLTGDDDPAIAQSYRAFSEALVGRNLDRPIFVTEEMTEDKDELFAPNMKAVPAGIAFRLLQTDSNVTAPIPTLLWRDVNYRKRDYYTDNARMLQATPLALTGQRATQHGDAATAARFLDAALRFKPDLSAKLDDLSERDRSFAETTNERFTQFQNLRNQLSQHK